MDQDVQTSNLYRRVMDTMPFIGYRLSSMLPGLGYAALGINALAFSLGISSLEQYIYGSFKGLSAIAFGRYGMNEIQSEIEYLEKEKSGVITYDRPHRLL